MTNVDPCLRSYVEAEILPHYDHFDLAHRRDHVQMVISQSLELVERLNARAAAGCGEPVNPDMAYAIAAYHDTGLCEGRDHHHEVSARIIKADERLREWFSEAQIQVMADAAEDHRASASHAPRTIYGRIVAEADRFIEPRTIVRRTIQYGLDHYPQMSRQEHFERMKAHLHEKYGRGGYLTLWFDDSPNAHRLELLRQLIDDETALKHLFDEETLKFER